jgi:DNA polymerase III subunit alpha
LDFVQAQGMKAVAMTDHGTLSGAVEFYKEAKARELKALIGIEAYVAARKHTDKDPQKDKSRYHLVLLAMNDQGYKNLMKLSTIANLEGFYYYPRIDRDLLETYNEGLIVLSGCMGGELGSALKVNDYVAARDIAEWYRRVFGDRYYLEVQDHGHPDNPLTNKEQQAVNKSVLKLSKELDIPAVVTCDAHYLNHEDQEAHEVLLCVGTGSYLSDEKRMSLKDYPLHVVPPQEIIGRWGQTHPDIVRNTRKVADRCSVDLNLGGILIPRFEVPKGHTEKSYLDELVFRGLVERYTSDMPKELDTLDVAACKKLLTKDVIARAEYELGVIDDMGFDGYFLIIWDFIAWGKSQGIVFGPGRGSAAGSIIAYALGITELDPLEHDLLFERFLNPDRISMPDIDIDIQDNRRNEVIQYCVDKYGADKVANIVTFGRMFARNAIRDVSRVLQVPYAEADRLAKMIPAPVQGRHIPLEKSLKEDPDLAREYQSNQQSKRVFDLAMQLEGTVRNHGVHAAGVVIAPDDITLFTPLEMAQKGVVSTQYSMNHIEELGLLKMDFLGLSNLTIIKNALRIIKKVYDTDMAVADIPLDDTKTYELLGRGDTTGVFQLESAGMKRYLKELQPSVFEDIVAMVALYRPGPMQFIDDFISRKHGKKEIKYLHPQMKNALENTYGVLVYQEQVMQISKDLAGFTGGQADTLRKGIAKKIPEVLAKMKVEFIDGAIKQSGADRGLMEAFWKQLEDFAAYCFNKSHAACYALIAYWTAYLKANYPAAFMAAVMTSDYDDTDRLAIEITECQHMGLEVLPPDVNESFVEFAVVPNSSQIRFGMNAIKNVGTGAVEEIIRARQDKPFDSIESFFQSVNTRVVNRKTIESLIKAGALDRFNDRSVLVHNIDTLLSYAHKVQKERDSGQTDIFGSDADGSTIHLPALALEPPPEPLHQRDLLLWERELLGLYLSQHPLRTFEIILSEQTVPLNSITSDHDKKKVVIGGAIQVFREITTKKGSKMAFATIEDTSGSIELVLFPGAYQQTLGIWERDRVVIVQGKVDGYDRDGNPQSPKIIVDEAREITHEQAEGYQATGRKKRPPKASAAKSSRAQVAAVEPAPTAVQPPKLYIRVVDGSNIELLGAIKSSIDQCPGDTDVVLVIGPDSQRQAVKLQQRVAAQEQLFNELADAVGAENVKLH